MDSGNCIEEDRHLSLEGQKLRRNTIEKSKTLGRTEGNELLALVCSLVTGLVAALCF
jgi:hypothetical protein